MTTTLMGIGACDTTETLSLRMLGMHGAAFANYAVEDCDFLIAVGARFDDRVAAVPDKFAPRARRVAHFDVDPAEIGKVKKVDWHHVGVLARDLEALLVYGERHHQGPDFAEWHRELAELKRRFADNYDRGSALIQPNYVIEETQQAHARRSHHRHRRRPAPDVGSAVLRFPPAAPVADFGQHGDDGLRPAGSHRRPVRAARTGW